MRPAAATIVAELAGRLRTPSHVSEVAAANVSQLEAAEDLPQIWSPQSLTHGYPGIALFYAELGHDNTDFRAVAHEYLSLAAKIPEGDVLYGQSSGLCAVAAGLRVAAYEPADYATMLARLEPHVVANAQRLIALQKSAHGQPTRAVVVDTLNGLTGVGRHLLARDSPASSDVLAALASLAEPVSWQGVDVPGWWYHASALLGEHYPVEFEQGSATFGLSHGITGPLTLLSLAWQAGRRVPGQQAAIETIAGWLLDWRERDAGGTYWPAHIPLSHYRDRTRSQPRPSLVSWCHGSWGIAHAVFLAGKALDRPDWVAAAGEVVLAILDRCRRDWPISSDCLCHGWAGVLYQLCLWNRKMPDIALRDAADEVAGRLVSRFRPEIPFGYHYGHPGTYAELNLPGLLEGATGIGLALHAYAADRPPLSGWDSVLLLN